MKWQKNYELGFSLAGEAASMSFAAVGRFDLEGYRPAQVRRGAYRHQQGRALAHRGCGPGPARRFRAGETGLRRARSLRTPRGRQKETPRRRSGGDSGAQVLAKGQPTLLAPEPADASAAAGSTSQSALDSHAALAASRSTSYFPSCTAPSARMAPSRACSNWPAWPMSAPACWAPRRAWTRT